MITILISWLAISFITLTAGDMFLRLSRKILEKEVEFNLFEKYWIGLAVVSSLSIILNFFIPLNIFVLITFLLVSILYQGFNKNSLKLKIKEYYEKFHQLSVLYKLLFILFAFVIFCLTLTLNSNYDTGLYHAQYMMWVDQYKIVPGLGNLHTRLAFNPSSLILYTLFGFHTSYFTSLYTLNGLTFLLFAFFILYTIFKSESIRYSIVLFLILLFSILSYGTKFSTSSTDILPNILIVYTLLRLATRGINSRNVIFYIVIPAYCLTLKLSSIPLCLISVVYITKIIHAKQYRLLSYIIIISSIIIMPWLGRFIILSGYILFPFDSIDLFSFDWKIPIEVVKREIDVTYAWGRISHPDYKSVIDMHFFEWFPIWLRSQVTVTCCLIWLLCSNTMMLICNIKSFTKNKSVFYTCLIALLGIIFAFNTAPDTRFFMGFLTIYSFIPFLLISRQNLQSLNPIAILVTMISILISLYLFKPFLEHYFDFNFAKYNLGHKGPPIFVESESIYFKDWFETYKEKIFFGLLISSLLITLLYKYKKTWQKAFLNIVLKNKLKTTQVLAITFILLSIPLFISRNIIKETRVNKTIFQIFVKPPIEAFRNDEINTIYSKYPLQNGTDVFYPDYGDRCFEHALPCSNRYNEGLRMRGHSLENGFYVVD